jgi:hypothetical protein
MAAQGRPLTRGEIKGRAMLFSDPDGKTVRVRTCNDHVLVAVASGTEAGSNLNIEGTDFLLIVMPSVPRTPGPVLAYLVPTDVAVEAVRETHGEWLKSGPATKGNNKTWNIWFDDDGPEKANGFAKKWARYLLADSNEVGLVRENKTEGVKRLGDVIAEAKQKIAAAAGVAESAVKISLDLA